ncbi:MAG: hypothetical protein ACRC48_06885 [Aeromonas veronii]
MMNAKTKVSIVVAGIAYVNHDLGELIAKLGREQVDAALAAEALKEAHAARSEAYRRESDPLYLEWKYDQTPEAEQVWRDKVAEIKARYPLPA